MKIFLGADHRGYRLKEGLKKSLKLAGHAVVDVGAVVLDPEDDYVDYAQEVASSVAKDPTSRGVLLCGSGHGVDIVANRYTQVRSILGFNMDVVVQGREHEDANVLSIPSDWVSEEEAQEMVAVFLETAFSGAERHQRRIEKVRALKGI